MLERRRATHRKSALFKPLRPANFRAAVMFSALSSIRRAKSWFAVGEISAEPAWIGRRSENRANESFQREI